MATAIAPPGEPKVETKTDTIAKKILPNGKFEMVAASQLRAGDVVLVEAGYLIPGDGEVIEGIASVDESVITGESAPVIRESGGDRSAVTGGTKVLSDHITVKITSNPGETFLDRMIALVEGAVRRLVVEPDDGGDRIPPGDRVAERICERGACRAHLDQSSRPFIHRQDWCGQIDSAQAFRDA